MILPEPRVDPLTPALCSACSLPCQLDAELFWPVLASSVLLGALPLLTYPPGNPDPRIQPGQGGPLFGPGWVAVSSCQGRLTQDTDTKTNLRVIVFLFCLLSPSNKPSNSHSHTHTQDPLRHTLPRSNEILRDLLMCSSLLNVIIIFSDSTSCA